MACQRDRILKIKEYLEDNGVTVNICKNKAQGNKGFFRSKNGALRIDISNTLDEDALLEVILHEAAHYIHYTYDSKLESLEKILGENYKEKYTDDLLTLTVDSIQKKSVEPIFQHKRELQNKIKILSSELKNKYPDFKISIPYNNIEKQISKTEYKHLLKYDAVRIFNGFSLKKYSVDNIEKFCQNIDIVYYIRLRSAQRALRRLNSKISKLNNYYNSYSELFARSIVYYLLKPDKMKKNTLCLYEEYEKIVKENKIPALNNLINIIFKDEFML